MAPDVTLFLGTLFILILKYSVVLCEDVRLVTQPLYYDDNYFFELMEPEEISYTYKIRPAKNFGVPINTTFFNIRLVPSVPVHGCSDISNSIYIKDAVAFMERGGCSFLTKTLSAELAGALAVVIFDHDRENDSRMIDMIQDETSRNANIPAFFLLGKDGYMIRTTLERLHVESAIINIPVNVTGIPVNHLNQPPWTLW